MAPGESSTQRTENLKKPLSGRRPLVSESVRVASQTAATVWGGFADSVATGFKSFREDLKADKVDRVGLSNGLVEAILAGNASFFEKMADTSRQLLEEVRSFNSQDLPRRDSGIDHERLAHMVASELRKQGAPDVREK